MSEAEQAPSTSGLAAGGDVGAKFNTAKEKKAAGDEAFKNNDIPGGACARFFLLAECARADCMIAHAAFKNYHEVRTYLVPSGRGEQGIEKLTPPACA